MIYVHQAPFQLIDHKKKLVQKFEARNHCTLNSIYIIHYVWWSCNGKRFEQHVIHTWHDSKWTGKHWCTHRHTLFIKSNSLFVIPTPILFGGEVFFFNLTKGIRLHYFYTLRIYSSDHRLGNEKEISSHHKYSTFTFWSSEGKIVYPHVLCRCGRHHHHHHRRRWAHSITLTKIRVYTVQYTHQHHLSSKHTFSVFKTNTKLRSFRTFSAHLQWHSIYNRYNYTTVQTMSAFQR